MTHAVYYALAAWGWFVACYFAIYIATNVVLAAVGLHVAVRDVRVRRPSTLDTAGGSPLTPTVSVTVPAYNESAGIVASTRALLGLRYPHFEIVVVDDGSTDDTFEQLSRAFDLVEVPVGRGLQLPSAPIRDVWVSRTRSGLRVVRKHNGGRADALNAGAAVARGDIIVAVDADSALDPDALGTIAQPFVDHPADTAAVGGTVRIVNGSAVVDGEVRDVRLPSRTIIVVQALEYLRGFLGGRIAWARMGALPIISGAFGAFRRDVLIRVGGFSTDTIGEDMELIVRMRRELAPEWPGMRVDYVPEAVCWTEAPERLSDLRGQRIRWHRGLLQIIRTHRSVIGNPRQGAFGMVAMPYVVLYEAFGPIVELSGYVVVALGLALGLIAIPHALLMAGIALLAGVLLSVTALVVEEVAFRRYPRRRDLARLLLFTVVENLGYRQLTLWWRLEATIQALRRREAGWGTIERRAVLAELAADDAGVLSEFAHDHRDAA